MTDSTRSGADSLKQDELEFLNIDQVKMIDEALCSIEKYGEVRLLLDDHRLRFIVCQESYDAYAFKPGLIRNHGKTP